MPRSHWGWGHTEDEPSHDDAVAAARTLSAVIGRAVDEIERPVPLDAVTLPAPRIHPPARLAGICASSRYDRVTHSYGKSYRDIVRAFRGRFDHPPDVVAYPTNERDIEDVLEWAESADAAVIPFGGGTSVVGGVEPRMAGRYNGSISLDLRELHRVLEVDRVSRAARVQAGVAGPALEKQLGAHGVTLRHFPQSFEFSTLGGWVATRAGGHFATLYTHIDDLVESIRAITPRGVWESRRLPGSGAGVSPDRILLGSEGTLGVVTQAWVRLQDKPTHRRSVGVRFDSFADGVTAVRAVSQAGLFPTNCRLIDATEARLTAGGDGERSLLVLGFESADHPVDGWLDRALALAVRAGGVPATEEGHQGGQVGAWRDAFIRAPYLRNVHPAIGLLSETFETAVTWDRFDDFHSSVLASVREAVQSVCGGGIVTCRFTYTYPDGPAPYYTILAPARRGAEIEQWDEIKQVAADALIAAGGTITHHHAVGRDHRPWYDRQRPDPFAAVLTAAKAAVDPKGVLNPGILVDPAPLRH